MVMAKAKVVVTSNRTAPTWSLPGQKLPFLGEAGGPRGAGCGGAIRPTLQVVTWPPFSDRRFSSGGTPPR